MSMTVIAQMKLVHISGFQSTGKSTTVGRVLILMIARAHNQ